MEKRIIGGFYLLLIVGYIYCELPIVARKPLMLDGTSRFRHSQLNGGIQSHIGQLGTEDFPDQATPIQHFQPIEPHSCEQNCLALYGSLQDELNNNPLQSIIPLVKYYKWLTANLHISPICAKLLKYYVKTVINEQNPVIPALTLREKVQYPDNLHSEVFVDESFPSPTKNDDPTDWQLPPQGDCHLCHPIVCNSLWETNYPESDRRFLGRIDLWNSRINNSPTNVPPSPTNILPTILPTNTLPTIVPPTNLLPTTPKPPQPTNIVPIDILPPWWPLPTNKPLPNWPPWRPQPINRPFPNWPPWRPRPTNIPRPVWPTMRPPRPNWPIFRPRPTNLPRPVWPTERPLPTDTPLPVWPTQRPPRPSWPIFRPRPTNIPRPVWPTEQPLPTDKPLPVWPTMRPPRLSWPIFRPRPTNIPRPVWPPEQPLPTDKPLPIWPTWRPPPTNTPHRVWPNWRPWNTI